MRITHSSYKYAKPISTFLFCFFMFSSPAQTVLLDSLTLDTLTAYTDINEALKHPEQVIKLELRRKKLKKFPIEILQFTNLQYLDLSKNSIKELPTEIQQLKDLQYLAISKNGLEELTPQIGELKNLYYLNLNQNDLSTLPKEIGKLERLRSLDLWSNNIDKFPDEIKDLKNLKILDLRVILIPDAEQYHLKSLLPGAKIHFSPYCKCQQ